MKRGLQDLNRPKLIKSNAPHIRTVPHTYQRAQCQQHHLPSPIEMKFGGILLDKRRVPRGWPACLRRQPPRVAFRNNDIYVIEDEDYEEPRERHPKVQYKLRLCDNPQFNPLYPYNNLDVTNNIDIAIVNLLYLSVVNLYQNTHMQMIRT